MLYYLTRVVALHGQAQRLQAVITTSPKLAASDHRVYVAVADDKHTVLGLIKVGAKHLFIRVCGGWGMALYPTRGSPARLSNSSHKANNRLGSEFRGRWG